MFCSIQALLSAPNPDDPLAENIAKEWRVDEAKAMRTGLPLLQKAVVACSLSSKLPSALMFAASWCNLQLIQ